MQLHWGANVPTSSQYSLNSMKLKYPELLTAWLIKSAGQQCSALKEEEQDDERMAGR